MSPARLARLAAALGLLAPLALFPRPVAAQAPLAAEDDAGPAEPLPPIELPQPKARARPADAPPPDAPPPDAPPPEAPAAEAPAAEPTPEVREERAGPPPARPRRHVERLSSVAILAEIGGFASAAGPGFVTDLGLRYDVFSLRYGYRAFLPGEFDASYASSHTLRLGWHRELQSWLHAFAGVGLGNLRGNVEVFPGGEWATVASSLTGVIEVGLVAEYEFISIASIGVELLLPFDRDVRSGPIVLLTATITPLVLLALAQ